MFNFFPIEDSGHCTYMAAVPKKHNTETYIGTYGASLRNISSYRLFLAGFCRTSGSLSDIFPPKK